MAAALLLAVSGCDDGDDGAGGAADMAVATDMAAAADMASGTDMAAVTDMAPIADMTPAIDMMPVVDMMPAVDMAPAVDMMPAPACDAASCFSNFDCAEGTLCLVDPADDARSCCQPGERGADPAGAECGGGDGERTCATAVCIEGEGVARCSTRCEEDADCPETMQFCFPIAIDEDTAESWCFPTD